MFYLFFFGVFIDLCVDVAVDIYFVSRIRMGFRVEKNKRKEKNMANGNMNFYFSSLVFSCWA